ncbi:polyhomeotic-like protein 2 [Mantella aurantiaca]
MTSGNGSSPLPAAATGGATQNGENKPPQAVVKPQILTHVIEGFVIQEGAQPFPSHRSRAALQVGTTFIVLILAAFRSCHSIDFTYTIYSSDDLKIKSKRSSSCDQVTSLLLEKLPQQDNNTTDSEMEEPRVPESKSDGNPPKLKCELCGRVNFEYKFKRSKRFCSMACAKRYNVGCTKRVGLFHPDRNKLQKSPLHPIHPVQPIQPVHTRRRSQKGSVTDLSTDGIKQISGSIPPSSPAPRSVSSPLKHINSQEESSRYSDISSYEDPLSPVSAISSLSRQRHRELTQHSFLPSDLSQQRHRELTQHSFLPSDPDAWNVEDVYHFIRSLPGCQEISEEFRLQEIDGQALLLLKEDHLMSAMNIKLGPALKIYARINLLKES